MHKRTADLGVAPLGPLLVKLSLPAMAGMLVMALYNVIDTYWVAHLGGNAVAALTVVFPWQMITAALGVGAGVGVASLVARRYGEGRGDEVNLAGGQVILLTVSMGVVLAVLAHVMPAPLLRLFGATPEIMPLARDYLFTVALGVPFVMFMMGTNGLYRGAGNTVLPTIVMTTSAVANAVLAPFLVLGLWHFPAMGVFGAGLSTALAQVLGSAFTLWHLRSPRSGFQIHWRHLRPAPQVVEDILAVGAPAGVMQLVGSAVISLYNRVLGSFGVDAIAAYGLSFRVMMLVFTPIMGLSQGLMPIVGFNYGARRYHRMWHAVRLATLTTSGTGLVLGGILEIFAPSVIHIFSADPRLMDLGVLAIRLAMLTLWIAGPLVMAVAALQGMGHGGHAMVLAVTRQLLFLVPALLWLSAHYGAHGAFAAQPIADVLSLGVTALFMAWAIRRYRPCPLEMAECPADDV